MALITEISLEIKLTDWGPVTHICFVILTIIGPDNGLSTGRHQTIIWTNSSSYFVSNKMATISINNKHTVNYIQTDE